MTDFQFETTRRVICETGGSSRLGELAQELGIRRLFLVTDPGLVRAGMIDPVHATLKNAGIEVAVFSDVMADPPEAVVLSAVAAAEAAGTDGVLGFGGGSSLDTAKLVALLRGSPQALPDIYGV